MLSKRQADMYRYIVQQRKKGISPTIRDFINDKVGAKQPFTSTSVVIYNLGVLAEAGLIQTQEDGLSRTLRLTGEVTETSNIDIPDLIDTGISGLLSNNTIFTDDETIYWLLNDLGAREVSFVELEEDVSNHELFTYYYEEEIVVIASSRQLFHLSIGYGFRTISAQLFKNLFENF